MFFRDYNTTETGRSVIKVRFQLFYHRVEETESSGMAGSASCALRCTDHPRRHLGTLFAWQVAERAARGLAGAEIAASGRENFGTGNRVPEPIPARIFDSGSSGHRERQNERGTGPRDAGEPRVKRKIEAKLERCGYSKVEDARICG